MKYLDKFQLPDEDQEYTLILSEKRRIFNNTYPLHIFPEKKLKKIELGNITIFYGGNGSGKSTLLNIIAEKLHAKSKNPLNRGDYFNRYVDLCEAELINEPDTIKIISSDDVFEYLSDMNSINNEVNRKKEMLMNEYFSNKNTMCRDLFDDYDKLKDKIAADKKTLSAYTRERLGSNNIMRQSNGETALLFWEREIQENAVYILDEPENSLSAENQLKLKKYIEESARFYKCQFILATHSPLLLSLNEAIIYDLDSLPVRTKKWFELDNVRIYFDFFNENKDRFE